MHTGLNSVPAYRLRAVVLGAALGWSNAALADVHPDPNCANVVGSQPVQYYRYGRHFPQGQSAVNYLYGPEGTWKQFTDLTNMQQGCSNGQGYWYYTGWTTNCATQPFNPTDDSGNECKARLIDYASGTNATSTPDANAHVLHQLAGGSVWTGTDRAFHEHNGCYGGDADGCSSGATCADGRGAKPFTQFWFDDNWLARYMSVAYGAPAPDGLWATSDFSRWQVMNGEIANWCPYPEPTNAIDLLALNGLYYFYRGDSGAAYSRWTSILNIAGQQWDDANQRYSYPGIDACYHLALFKILTERLMDSGAYTGGTLNNLVEHSMSLRSNILSAQRIKGGAFIGWSSRQGGSTMPTNSGCPYSNCPYINTENTAAAVLALGVDAVLSYEAGRSPLSSTCPQSGSNPCYLRPHNVFSAILSPQKSQMSGHMVYGPYVNLAPRAYAVDFYLRSPSFQSSDSVANLDVHDANSGQILRSKLVRGSDLVTGNHWTRISLSLTSAQISARPNNSLEFRVWWYGNNNLDVAAIRVR